MVRRFRSGSIKTFTKPEIIFPSLAIAALMFTAYYPRFLGLKEFGLFGSDTIFYWSMAHKWANGEYTTSFACGYDIFRPLIYLIYSFAIKFFDGADYAIKALNASLDMVNIALIIVIGRVIAGNVWVGLLSAAVYAFNPRVISYARCELVHIPLATALLTSFLLVLYAERAKKEKSRLALLFLSSLILGASVFIHPIAVLLIPAFFLYTLVSRSLTDGEAKRSVKGASTDLAVYYLIYLIGVALKPGGFTALANPDYMAAKEAFTPGLYLDVLFNVTRSFITINSSFTFLGLTLVAIGLAQIPLYKKLFLRISDPNPSAYLLIIYIVSYLFFYTFSIILLDDYMVNPRHFIQIMPFASLAVIYYFHTLLPKRYYTGALLVTTFIAAGIIYTSSGLTEIDDVVGDEEKGKYRFSYFDPTPGKTGLASMYKPYGMSLPREVYEVAKNHVNDKAKILLANSVVYSYPHRRIFQTPCYFGDNILYMIDQKKPFDQIVEKNNVKFVMLFTIQERYHFGRKNYCRYDNKGNWRLEPMELGKPYGIEKGKYKSAQEEIDWTLKYLQEKNAKLVYAKRYANLSHSLIEIYQLPDESEKDTQSQ